MDLRIKQKSNGSVEQYNVFLVVKGFTQQPEIDDVDTFSSFIKSTIIWIVPAIITQNK